MRRLNRESEFAEVLQRSYKGEDYVLLPNSQRYVLPIPDNELNVTGIEQNER